MKKVFWTDLWLVACVVMGALAAYTGGALGVMIGMVLVSSGVLVSMMRRVVASVKRSAAGDLGGAARAVRVPVAAAPQVPERSVEGAGGAAAALRSVSDSRS